MSAYALLNLLNELGFEIKCDACRTSLSLFAMYDEFDTLYCQLAS